jgi:hypothetical protein
MRITLPQAGQTARLFHRAPPIVPPPVFVPEFRQ